jgi:cysteine desulfuration protein SufE
MAGGLEPRTARGLATARETRYADGTLIPESTSDPTTPGGAEELAERLRRLPDPQSRLQLAVDLARRRPALPDVFRTDAHRVPGCLVRLWFVAGIRDGRCWFAADSDAVSLKALVGLMCELQSGLRPEEIEAEPAARLESLGLLRQLAESRRATILRVAGMIRAHAAGLAGFESNPSAAERPR